MNPREGVFYVNTKVDVVVGAQFGSEAKGHVTQRVIERHLQQGDKEILNIRVAGPNAGHTAHTTDGVAVAFRQLPVGALIPGVDVMIAPGSEVQPDVLLEEIDRAIRYGDFDPGLLYVDANATILEPHHIEMERGMHESMGSTGKGVGAARVERIMRTAKIIADDEDLMLKLDRLGVNIVDAFDQIHYVNAYDRIVVEGTQGYGLGLHAGYYPHTTSSDCRAIDFLAMAGINPWWWGDSDVLSVWAVARVYPIRVAGPSGPLLDETTWEALGLPEERTTVTKKVRRVGRWDHELVANAVSANGGAPTVRLAITMLDQKFPDLAGVTETDKVVQHDEAFKWLQEIDADACARIELVTTGPNTGVFL